MNQPLVKLGNRFGPEERRVDPDWAIAYALATNDPNPAYLEGGVVPPVFTVSMILPLFLQANADMLTPGAVVGATGGAHGQHDLYLHKPVAPGSTLRFFADGYHASNTPAGARTTVRVQLFDEGGDLCVEHFWTTIHIKGTVTPAGPPLADHELPAGAKDKPIGSLVIPISGDQTYRYAGASWDHAMIHMDDVAARNNGMPRKFLQGLCTAAMCSQAVIQFGADGDPRRLRRLAMRFSAPVFTREDLTIDTFDGGRTAAGRHVVAFEASCLGRAAIRHGWAELD